MRKVRVAKERLYSAKRNGGRASVTMKGIKQLKKHEEKER
jgi:hypothetical protein